MVHGTVCVCVCIILFSGWNLKCHTRIRDVWIRGRFFPLPSRILIHRESHVWARKWVFEKSGLFGKFCATELGGQNISRPSRKHALDGSDSQQQLPYFARDTRGFSPLGARKFHLIARIHISRAFHPTSRRDERVRSNCRKVQIEWPKHTGGPGTRAK